MDDTLVIGTCAPPKKKEVVRLQPISPALLEDLVLDLSHHPARIGRSTEGKDPQHPNFYPVPHRVVSRNHVEIWVEGSKLFIRDNGSASGTYVNGTRISPAGVQSAPCEISHDTLLQLGNNYTDDERSLLTDPSLRCIQVRVKFLSELDMTLVPAPTSHSPSFGSSPHSFGSSPHLPPIPSIPGIGSPPQHAGFGSPVASPFDLENLTHVIHLNKVNSVYGSDSGSRRAPGSPIDPRSSVIEPAISDAQRKKELDEKLKDLYHKFSSRPQDTQRNTFFVGIIILNHKLLKVSIQGNGKEAFSVSSAAWDTNKKILVQDLRRHFTASPSIEVISDPISQSRYHVVNHNGGTMLASIEKLEKSSGVIELKEGSPYQAQGDLSESYRFTADNSVIAEIQNLENNRNYIKGYLSRILSVTINKDFDEKLILVATMIFGLITP